jgi:hypothetical protein
MKSEAQTIRDREMEEARKNIWSKLEEIHREVKKTNGRVNALEAWKNKVTGGVYVLTVIAAIIAFVIRMGWISIN